MPSNADHIGSSAESVSSISIDPRSVTPLLASREAGIERFPRDTLHRVAITLNLFSDLIGRYDGKSDSVFSENHKFALALQLTGMADLLEAVADGLGSRKITLNPDEIAVTLGEEERAKLRILASRRETSVAALAASFVRERLSSINLGG